MTPGLHEYEPSPLPPEMQSLCSSGWPETQSSCFCLLSSGIAGLTNGFILVSLSPSSNLSCQTFPHEHAILETCLPPGFPSGLLVSPLPSCLSSKHPLNVGDAPRHCCCSSRAAYASPGLLTSPKSPSPAVSFSEGHRTLDFSPPFLLHLTVSPPSHHVLSCPLHSRLTGAGL